MWLYNCWIIHSFIIKFLNLFIKIKSHEILQLFLGMNFVDPIGPLPTRPMTAAGKRDDDFGDEELGDDLLPE